MTAVILWSIGVWFVTTQDFGSAPTPIDWQVAATYQSQADAETFSRCLEARSAANRMGRTEVEHLDDGVVRVQRVDRRYQVRTSIYPRDSGSLVQVSTFGPQYDGVDYSERNNARECLALIGDRPHGEEAHFDWLEAEIRRREDLQPRVE